MVCPHIIGAGLLVVLLLGVASAQYDDEYPMYDDAGTMQELYKRLAELDYLENGYPDQRWLEDDQNIALDSRDSGQAQIRDQEYLEHSSQGGFQYISGGAGEGKQHLTPDGTENNTQEVKSDETLPFYCHPPNPCPKGYTAKDGCDENIKDDAEFQLNYINNLMNSGACTCDEEHMSCAPKKPTINTEKGHRAQDKLDNIINNIFAPNPYLKADNKRESLVAKKSPGMNGVSFDIPM